MPDYEPTDKEYIRRVVQEELTYHAPKLAVVNEVFPHSEEGDDSNYEVGVSLLHGNTGAGSRPSLERVPVAVSMHGAGHGLQTDDMVIVSFLNGDGTNPLVTHVVYGDEDGDRAPLLEEGEYRMRLADGAVFEIVQSDDGGDQMINLGLQEEDRGGLDAGLSMNLNDESFTLQDGAGKGVTFDGQGNGIIDWESMAMPWGAAGPVDWEDPQPGPIAGRGPTATTQVQGSNGQPIRGAQVTIEAEEERSAAVQQGWGEPVASMSSDFREGSLEGKWGAWGDSDGCYEPSTWNGLRCGRNSTVTDGMHRIEGTVDGTTSGATSTTTFTYGRIEYRERAYCVDNCDNETYNVTPIIYPANPESQIAGNGEMDIAERRIGDTPFFVVHWNDDNYYINVSGLDGTQWHNYAIDWQPDSISWYVDGYFVDSFDLSIDMEAEYNAGQMDMFPETGTPMHHAYEEIDWVKFYEYDASGQSPIPQNDHSGGTNWQPTEDNVASGIGWNEV